MPRKPKKTNFWKKVRDYLTNTCMNFKRRVNVVNWFTIVSAVATVACAWYGYLGYRETLRTKERIEAKDREIRQQQSAEAEAQQARIEMLRAISREKSVNEKARLALECAGYMLKETSTGGERVRRAWEDAQRTVDDENKELSWLI